MAPSASADSKPTPTLTQASWNGDPAGGPSSSRPSTVASESQSSLFPANRHGPSLHPLPHPTQMQPLIRCLRPSLLKLADAPKSKTRQRISGRFAAWTESVLSCV
eukprot:2907829-Rhodomonas_salina.1